MNKHNEKRLNRRVFAKLCAQYGAASATLTGLLSGCTTIASQSAPVDCKAESNNNEGYDYIVVGSGAGGGPLAANLARAGYRVLLLEAGGEEEPYNYQVPVFHALASEDKRLRWDFFVRHYNDSARQRLDDKYVEHEDGVLYPRAGTLGGCTAHHAMITIYPHNSDWDHIAEVTADSSWNSANMRRYFQRIENCQYVRKPADPELDPARHGFGGWLSTNTANPKLVLRDAKLLRAVLRAVWGAAKTAIATRDLGRLRKLKRNFDPNDWRTVADGIEGICVTPMSTQRGKRHAVREYIRSVQNTCSNQLVIKTHALVTKVVFDDHNTASGVEFLEGAHLYGADPNASANIDSAVKKTINAKREVILSGGAFNTPQLLKLSGIGPEEELSQHGIDVRVALPGVGENLQDRYEVGVVLETENNFSLLEGATFRGPEPGEAPDPHFVEWQGGEGVYTTNGAILSIIKRSESAIQSTKGPQLDPDLFIFGVAGFFKGYFPEYSKSIVEKQNYLTWAILKAHTNNTAGRVTLRSNDPLEVPQIDFHYFDEGNDTSGADLDAVVDGIEHVRKMINGIPGIMQETIPGPSFQSREALRDFVKNNAWGHHASCSCKMGPETDPLAVVDSNFRVHGTNHLRVVDASVFPRIPGFFIVTPIYMISEKASDVIIAEAQNAS